MKTSLLVAKSIKLRYLCIIQVRMACVCICVWKCDFMESQFLYIFNVINTDEECFCANGRMTMFTHSIMYHMLGLKNSNMYEICHKLRELNIDLK